MYFQLVLWTSYQKKKNWFYELFEIPAVQILIW